MKHALVLMLLLSCPAAFAQGLPAAFQVSGVAQGDVLNIRAEPKVSALSIGSIQPFAQNVEVLEKSGDGKWGLVGLPEGNGWVSLAHLRTMPSPPPHQVPRPLSCFGTEPFWSVSLYPRGAEFNSPDTGMVPMTELHEAVSDQGYLVTLQEGPTLDRTLIITRESCSDGMSDRRYGFATRMFLEAPDGNAAFSGCCTLDHR
jgi:uncharacterized membrane protein